MYHLSLSSFLFFSMLSIQLSCTSQEPTQTIPESSSTPVPFLTDPEAPDTTGQIGEYVVEIFEDSKGNLWFGTISKGVARFDGKTLQYFTTKDGLPTNTVVDITEDKSGNLWMATHDGLSKYDTQKNTFTNYTIEDDLPHHRLSRVLIDSKGVLWIGSWGGVGFYDGENFKIFPLPTPDVELYHYQSTVNWVTEIIEDQKGNIWFTRDGYGVCKYDGKSFTTYTKKDGLPSNNVQAITEDQKGNIWLGCRVAEKDAPDEKDRKGAGGLCRYDGNTFLTFPNIKGLHHNDIYSTYEDRKGNIWIGANGAHGLYQYDGKDFTLYHQTDRPDLMPFGYGIQSILEDQKGSIWLGLSGGLFRLEEDKMKNVKRDEM